MVANLVRPSEVNRHLCNVPVVSGPLAHHHRLTVLHDASEGTPGKLGQLGCPFLSQLHQGKGIVKVKSGKNNKLLDLVWSISVRYDHITSRVDHLPI